MKDLRQKFIKKYGRVPNKKEFAEFSGYSREALTTAQDKINLKLVIQNHTIAVSVTLIE